MTDMRSVRLNCLAKVSYISTDHLFGPLKQHLECRQLTKISNEDMFFLSGCQSRSPISTTMEYLNLCHEVGVHSRELCKKYDASVH
jgi:hypothetical protein